MNLPLTAAELAARFRAVRDRTEQLCEPLQTEDFVVQSMPDASPVKWHLAHTTWFFETFVLEACNPNFRPFHPQFRVLFNSYYEAVGPKHARAERGLLTRPSVLEVRAYRHAIDEALLNLLQHHDGISPSMAERIELGLHHEQQHQELILTDLLHAFSRNPLAPVYIPRPSSSAQPAEPLRFTRFAGGLESIGQHAIGHDARGNYAIGHDARGDYASSFAFDNERPRHKVFVEPYELATGLVSAAEYLEFIQDGGYRRPELWLSDGWAAVQTHGLEAPLYWQLRDAEQRRYSLHGELPIEPHTPVSHISFYEADAYARWASARLPTEQEWELAYARDPISGHFAEANDFIPRQTGSGFGSTWVWTASPYVAYRGFVAAAGAIGEYNGKFMCNQIVLRGGSCFTPESHLRATYRNFFPALTRWQVSGIRLAR